MKFFRIASYLLAFLMIAVQCKEDEEVDPSIITLDAKVVSANSILVMANLENLGNIPILDYGFEYGVGGYLDQKISLGNSPVKGILEKQINVVINNYGNLFGVRIYLTNEKGTAYGETKQVVLPAIGITSVNPLSAKIGDQITINGTAFSTDVAENKVMFNDTQANVVSATNTKLVVEVPSNISNSYYYYGIRITIRVGGQQIIATENFKLLPTVTDFSPKTGPIGTQITITGNNFNGYSASVLVGSVNINLYSISNNAMVFAIPGEITTENLPIKLNLNGIVYDMGEFIIAKPTISDFSPKEGIAGTEITIVGSNLGALQYYSNSLTVKLGSVNCYIVNQLPTEVIVTVPRELDKGDYTLSLSTNVHTVTANDMFKLASPSITSVEPSSALVGTYITINGKNFGKQTSYYENTIMMGTTQLSVYSWSETSIRALIPLFFSPGSYKVTVNSGGQSVTSSQSIAVTN